MGQVVSFKVLFYSDLAMIVLTHIALQMQKPETVSYQEMRDKINSNLPPEIRIFGKESRIKLNSLV